MKPRNWTVCNPAALAALSSAAAIGGAVDLSLSSSRLATGLGLGSGALSAGAVGFSLPVPGDPAVVGVEVAFQSAVVRVFAPGTPIELSNGLALTITE